MLETTIAAYTVDLLASCLWIIYDLVSKVAGMAVGILLLLVAVVIAAVVIGVYADFASQWEDT